MNSGDVAPLPLMPIVVTGVSGSGKSSVGAAEGDVVTIDAALPADAAVRAVVDFLSARGAWRSCCVATTS